MRVGWPGHCRWECGKGAGWGPKWTEAEGWGGDVGVVSGVPGVGCGVRQGAAFGSRRKRGGKAGRGEGRKGERKTGRESGEGSYINKLPINRKAALYL